MSKGLIFMSLLDWNEGPMGGSNRGFECPAISNKNYTIGDGGTALEGHCICMTTSKLLRVTRKRIRGAWRKLGKGPALTMVTCSK